MVASAVLIEYAIWTTTYPTTRSRCSPPTRRSSPRRCSTWGWITFILGAVVAALPFFSCIWQEKREHPDRTLPLVTFGAFVTGIIAVEALLGGLITYVPTFLWRIGRRGDTSTPPGTGTCTGSSATASQQINLAAMVTVWYFMTYLTAGAEVVSEKVSRGAFILYLFFINMGAAHHLMADPGVSASWKMWNTSYAMYGAVLASLIHAFAIPAGLEAGRRKRGLGGDSWFGWLKTAPWHDPGFSATAWSIILFGFLGGITGVLMGQMQLNTMRHNTLAVPGHFHGTVAVGTTLAFMGLVYYVIRLIFRKEWVLELVGPAAAVPVRARHEHRGHGDDGGGHRVRRAPRRDPITTSIPGTDFSFSAASPMLGDHGDRSTCWPCWPARSSCSWPWALSCSGRRRVCGCRCRCR